MPSFETTRRVGFTPRQMLDLVADVEKYPLFFPLCEALAVRSREMDGHRTIIVADMTVGYKAIRETITSRVTVDPGRMDVVADLVQGPFRELKNIWAFTPAPGGCDVRFFISYEFKSMMLQMLVGAVFDRAFRRCVEAFEERARVVYGAETQTLGSPAADSHSA
jgi:coenzyme Q-binding protein COQ10